MSLRAHAAAEPERRSHLVGLQLKPPSQPWSEARLQQEPSEPCRDTSSVTGLDWAVSNNLYLWHAIM